MTSIHGAASLSVRVRQGWRLDAALTLVLVQSLADRIRCGKCCMEDPPCSYGPPVGAKRLYHEKSGSRREPAWIVTVAAKCRRCRFTCAQFHDSSLAAKRLRCGFVSRLSLTVDGKCRRWMKCCSGSRSTSSPTETSSRVARHTGKIEHRAWRGPHFIASGPASLDN